jgi:hypothetical protein
VAVKVAVTLDPEKTEEDAREDIASWAREQAESGDEDFVGCEGLTADKVFICTAENPFNSTVEEKFEFIMHPYQMDGDGFCPNCGDPGPEAVATEVN